MTPLDKLRSVYALRHPKLDPSLMPINDTILALLDLVYQEMDARSWVKRFPPGYAEGIAPQRNVGLGLCEIDLV